jgi:hypothetical protein
MFEKRLLRGLLLAMGLALLVALSLPMLALADEDDPPGEPDASAVGHVTISGDPLTIHVAEDTSIQVFYAGQSDGQVYPPGFNEADSGGFGLFEFQVPGLSFGPEIWSPNFLAHDSSTANMMIPWGSAGPQMIMGTGTAADPWWVRTDVFGPLVFTVTQWVRYVDGDPCFTVSYTINDGEIGLRLPIRFFHAANMHPDGDEGGFGYYDAATGAVGAWNGDRDFLEYLVPYTEMGLPPASHYQEAGYQTIWNAIGTGPNSKGPGFNDTIVATTYHDAACGLQWDLVLPGVQPPGNFIEFGLDWCFLEVEEPEFVPEPGSILLLASGFMGLAGYAGLRKWRR